MAFMIVESVPEKRGSSAERSRLWKARGVEKAKGWSAAAASAASSCTWICISAQRTQEVTERSRTHYFDPES